MKDTLATTLICPFCAEAAPRSFGRNSARCEDCGGVLSEELLVALHQIAMLPAAGGRHACECGHPEMRLLPDGVYRCPTCVADVTPSSAGPRTWKSPSTWTRTGAAGLTVDTVSRLASQTTGAWQDGRTHPTA
jgi:ribosomal protein L37AE/L43A